MKTAVMKATLVYLVIGITRFAAGLSAESNGNPMLEMMKKHPPRYVASYTGFVERATWPSEKTIRSLNYKGDVRYEISQLRKNLKRILNSEYQPVDNDVTNKTIALKEFWHADDFLLLRYKTRNGADIQIQDGDNLYIMIKPLTDRKVDLDYIGPFIKKTSARFLNIPNRQDSKVLNSNVFVSSLRAKGGKVGDIRHLVSPGSYERNWYSGIRWWSDGRDTLFVISKITLEEQKALTKRAKVVLAGYEPPRRFRSRIATQPNQSKDKP